MTSYILQNYNELKNRHYIRKAGSRDYWFDFTHNRLQSFRENYGDAFCLVLYASDTVDDCYIIPFIEVKKAFADSLLDNRNRWSGYISKDTLHVVRHPNSKVISVAPYFNNFELLWTEGLQIFGEIEIDETLENIDGELEISNLHQLIEEFNRRYREVKPQMKRIISERVSRPGAISNYIKRLRNYTCEICGEEGFEQQNGNLYIETHHIIELHELIPSSYCSDNIIVVCPTCHRKLHYAKVQYNNIGESQIVIEVNGVEHQFSRNVITQD